MGWYHSRETLLDFEDLVMCLDVNPHHCTIDSATSAGPAHLIPLPLREDEMSILISRPAEVDLTRSCSCSSSRKKVIASVVGNVGRGCCAESNQRLG
jgi:hypothetical protein